MQSIDSIETHVYGTIKDLISRKEEIKCSNIIKEYNKTIDDVTKEKTKEHNPNWPEILDDPYRILMVGGSVSRKTNWLFNLISQQLNINKVFIR